MGSRPPPCSEPKDPSISEAFAALADERALIRERQRAAKERKAAARSVARHAASKDEDVEEMEVVDGDDYPCSITIEEYFAACPRRFFTDPNLAPTEENLEVLMRLVDANKVIGKDRRGTAVRLSEFQYFPFVGPEAQIWDPAFFARLAYEGFFTITQGRTGTPLPELQPFYGVVDWDNLRKAKHVRKALRKVQARCQADGAAPKYHLYHSRDLWGTYERLDSYQRRRHGTNWMTRQYFEVAMQASDDPRINFRVHSIELYNGPFDAETRPELIAGEIGFSFGRVYMSLSGFCDVAFSGAGTAQLACLGRWLDQRGYAFWSLGHCYSPEMDYKRQLGHRIYTRGQFLHKLRAHRGSFRTSTAPDLVLDGFSPLVDREECDLAALLQAAAG